MERNIENLITNTISNLKEILDVDSIIGKPIKVGEFVTIIPICKMNMGLISGGNDIGKDKLRKSRVDNFVGASGTGISYVPIGLLCVIKETVKYIPLGEKMPYYDLVKAGEKILDKLLDKNGENNEK